MRKPSNFRGLIFVMSFLLSAVYVQAQMTIRGQVTTSDGKPVPNASVEVVGREEVNTNADAQGNYSIEVPAEGAKDGTVTLKAYTNDFEKDMAVPYHEGATAVTNFVQQRQTTLTDVVVIGYGAIKKKDATGSVALITTEDMNQGPIVTADNLLTGRVAGVNLIPNGNPGTGSTIRIRGGASLDASNDPLLVVDGLPLESASLSQINPNDIESFSILKDASATAIFGSRASNGVILITTKKGSAGKWRFNYDAQFSYNTLPYKIKVLSTQDFIDAVTALGPKSEVMLGLGGYVDVNGNVVRGAMSDTDWQDKIYSNTIGTAHNFSARGNIGGILPSRFTVGYNDTPGLLNTSGYQRTNFSMALNPKFLNNTLKIDFTANASFEKYGKADEGVIADAIFFDPTKPVYSKDTPYYPYYLGYFEWGPAGTNASYNPVTGNYVYNTLAAHNPVSRLDEVNHTSDVRKFWGNFQVDYSFPFLKGLRAVVNLGFQYQRWFEDNVSTPFAGTMFKINDDVTKPIGSEWHNDGWSQNKLLDAYLNYVNTFGKFKVDLTGGYSYQYFNQGREYNGGDIMIYAVDGSALPVDKLYTQKVLVSFFGRANFTWADKYLLTATIRRDGSSMFFDDLQWGNFPAASFAWRIGDEDFMKNQNLISDLKLRAGWGITGQQNLYGDEKINLNRYLPLYGVGNNRIVRQYPFGGAWYDMMYPLAYNPNLKWEETTTWNAGLDFGFADQRLTGTFDAYYKKSKDLLANVQIPVGSNFATQNWMNIGSFTTKGIELGLNYDIVKNRAQGAFNWSAAYNVSLNKVEITDYPLAGDNVRGGVNGANGFYSEIFSVGWAPYSYWVYKQVYDSNHNPIEGAYVDIDGDGHITEADKYLYHHPSPDATMGLSTNLSWKGFDFSMAWRASIGNYIYNNVKAINSYAKMLNPSGSYLKNIVSAEFTEQTPYSILSDMWIENGSFLKWDNATLGYSFNNPFGEGSKLRIYGSVQNILCITKADTDDPEVDGGILWNLYPRPRTYVLGFNFDF
jgi:iron complex outermembrane receptor protein